jgi:hypothetical protein
MAPGKIASLEYNIALIPSRAHQNIPFYPFIFCRLIALWLLALPWGQQPLAQLQT